MSIECARHVPEQLQPAIREHRGSVAILSNRTAVMGHQDDIRTPHPLPERRYAFASEPLVPNLSDFIDQVHIEIDPEARAEGKSGPHAGGVGINRHVPVFAQFGEFLDIAQRRPQRRAVNPGNERRVFPSGQCAMEGAPLGARTSERSGSSAALANKTYRIVAVVAGEALSAQVWLAPAGS